MASNVFHRTDQPLSAASAHGCVITDVHGRTYLDAAGGAIACCIGHGDERVISAMADQAASVDYVHAGTFTTEVLEHYAQRLAPLVPTIGCHVFPVSGGSEAIETAIKLARTVHLANGEHERHVIIGRLGSYHGNSRGALDASHRPFLQQPYEPWLGQTLRVPAAYPYREPLTATEHADVLREAIEATGPEQVAAFVAEPIAGATLAASVPPAGYWPAMAAVCEEYGVLLIADEVMTGFGRTGRWFASEHFDLRPDIVTAGKGASGGYWPLGLCIASDSVHASIHDSGFVHGFTWSHHPIGAAVAAAVLDVLEDDNLVDASAEQGTVLRDRLIESFADSRIVGDVRGRGLLVGVELVADRGTKAPFARSEQVVERVARSARERGLLVYTSAGLADGVDGDAVLLGPPYTVDDDDIDAIVVLLDEAITAVDTELRR